MFIVLLNYKKPLAIVDQYVVAHRAYLDECYRHNFLVVSGPKNPRTGGVIISQLKNREQLDNILQQDPFFIHGVADYEIIEFNPIKHHVNFAAFI